MEPSNLELTMKVLEQLLRVLSPNRRTFVTTDSKMLQLVLFILFRRVNLSFV